MATRAARRANLVNLERVSKAYGIRPLLTEVSLGVQAGDRVGVVGRNGDGKTTLLAILAGTEPVDSGRATVSRGLRVGMLRQSDELPPGATVAGAVFGEMAEHEWASDPAARDVVEHLLADLDLDRTVDGLSGGERRRVALAALLLQDLDLLLLDEPTNHLDVEAVAWLAGRLADDATTLVAVTHDRWFLDAVCTTTWEVHDAAVDAYDGGYAAFVLAKAERMRQAAAAETRRRNLVRKELAWLRRGAPARTSKPKFRLDAAADLVADEPPPRDGVALQRFAATRLGNDVLDLEDATISRGGRDLVDRVTWRLGPGDRVGLVGVNGAGKTSVLSVLAGDVRPDGGRLRRGRTVELAVLRQSLDEMDPAARVLASVEAIKRVVALGGGREVTATSMLERFGFTGDKLTARIGDLSGGERRRLQLLRLLLAEPNVLLLDEPTNDLDIETLNVVEDFLDSWPGTLVVVSHDRYFLERVCDSIWALLGDGRLVMLPGGVDEYLSRRASTVAAAGPERAGVAGAAASGTRGGAKAGSEGGSGGGSEGGERQVPDAAAVRAARKDVARLDRQLAKVSARVDAVHAAMAEHASDYARLAELDAELQDLQAQKDDLELAWLTAAEQVE
jgi:ATP-binding cassette subfamily F protein uup